MSALVHLEIRSMTGSPYSQSRALDIQRNQRESHEDFDERIWREKGHYNERGEMIIPGQQIIRAIQNACKKFGHQVPGRGKTTYTKFFDSGIDFESDLIVHDHEGKPVTQETVEGIKIHCDATGKPGGSRVWRRFPLVPNWQGSFDIYVLDDTITKTIFSQVIQEAGKFIGIGRWRPQNRGRNGKFVVEKLEWKVINDSLQM